MGVILIILGVAVVGFGIFGASQPRFNRAELFRSRGGTLLVFSVGVVLVILGLYFR